MAYKYNSFSIDKFNGKTYWHKAFETMEEVQAHCKRYVHFYCDLIIYEIPDPKYRDQSIKFVKVIENYNQGIEDKEIDNEKRR